MTSRQSRTCTAAAWNEKRMWLHDFDSSATLLQATDGEKLRGPRRCRVRQEVDEWAEMWSKASAMW